MRLTFTRLVSGFPDCDHTLHNTFGVRTTPVTLMQVTNFEGDISHLKDHMKYSCSCNIDFSTRLGKEIKCEAPHCISFPNSFDKIHTGSSVLFQARWIFVPLRRLMLLQWRWAWQQQKSPVCSTLCSLHGSWVQGIDLYTHRWHLTLYYLCYSGQ